MFSLKVCKNEEQILLPVFGGLYFIFCHPVCNFLSFQLLTKMLILVLNMHKNRVNVCFMSLIILLEKIDQTYFWGWISSHHQTS